MKGTFKIEVIGQCGNDVYIKITKLAKDGKPPITIAALTDLQSWTELNEP